jgi:deoxyribodipyrimidine photolyase-like uncharacterized protein
LAKKIIQLKKQTFNFQTFFNFHIISTDEDPGLRIESFAVINLRGVSTNKTIICFIAMQTYKELIKFQGLEIITVVAQSPSLCSGFFKM